MKFVPERPKPSEEEILGDSFNLIEQTRLSGQGVAGSLPLTEDILRNEPSGNLFALTQNVAMGWTPEEVNRDHFLILSTHGGLRAENGTPLALGYHTGHWEVNVLVRRAAETFRANNTIPFAGYCTDPCDGRSQGTEAMFDSLPYRNDAAMVMRRLIRSLPTRNGVMGVATCDKGMPAMMLALTGCGDLPCIIVPGGVTLPTEGAEDAGAIQTIGARFAHQQINLPYAAEMGCRACGSSGGGCQFLGTAATSQMIAEALGMSLPHSALAPSGEPIWMDIAHRSALALLRLQADHIPLSNILTQAALENAMLLYAACGGSTNLLLHIPAIAYAAGLSVPTVHDWQRINRMTPRLLDALPNGPRNHPTVQVFMAGGVPEIMLHLAQMELLNLSALTVSGKTLGEVLDWWKNSERRYRAQRTLAAHGIEPENVIMNADAARRAGLTSTLVFPVGNLAPQGAVIKATSIDPSVIDAENVYYHRGPVRVFTSEQAAIQAIKGQSDHPVRPGDVVAVIGIGPTGTGMEEIYQVTSALKFIPWGKQVAVITDGRFSGVSTGACIGHIGPEALAEGPIGKLRDGDIVEIRIDRHHLEGSVNLVAVGDKILTVNAADELLSSRSPHPQLRVHSHLPDDTRLWAALQEVSGGTWSGCVYDVDRIVAMLKEGSTKRT